ncbi:hypothetical protein DLD77_01495 [Chitinophaga alhagiae]|uniref:TonB C-terminal domain-containing protein n=1 Tax=Chitinophaga alhagiae TaxID=2203219 RepID=A0ABM6W989_9BACT|nr:energy transducer TonB [Chitinophaga alhagiae]AWO00473.1 hypothetical protein DLD77_01495 [Chitinophaga alhagiae]
MTRYLIILPFLLLLALPAAAQVYRDAAFPGGLDSLVQYVQRRVKVPDAGPLTEKGTYVTVEFTVTTKGKITQVRTPRGATASPYLDALVEVVEGLPDFTPGVIRGKRSDVEYSLSGKFSVKKAADSVTMVRTFELEQPPRFPGGLAGLADFLSYNVKYPRDAIKNGVSGIVKVSFDVDQNGVPVNISVPGRQLGYGLEEEGIRVVSEMPDWMPGIQHGKKVKVHFNLPIRFRAPLPRL